VTAKESTINRLACWIADRGGRAILVGGAVRDWIIAGSPCIDYEYSQDIDIEVFGLTLPRLQDLLTSHGIEWDEVGEHFSVLKAHFPDFDQPIDLSIPRYETSTGDGHREFSVMENPELTFTEATRRRDFTMNSLGFDILSGELLDPYNGRFDIEYAYIRHVSDAFSEDPLRPLRAARFAARFGYSFILDTMDMCRSMTPLAQSLPSERVWMEVEKNIHESLYPGNFFQWLQNMHWLELLFPEIAALRGVEQDKEWHPEGDVFEHTMHALDYWAANLRTGNKEDDLITAIAILCHDFGKVTTTEWNEEKQHITAYGHEEAGAEPTRTFLHRLRQYELAKEVVPLVENHLAPVYSSPTPKSIRRLSVKVKRLDLLANLSRADQAGRPPKDFSEGFAKIDEFEEAVSNMQIPQGGPKPLVCGDYLIELGLTPGPAFKTILDDVYEMQLEGEITTEWEAHERVHFFVNEWALN
jgi:tRNA nucleotidyltransferase (CCA-adding enzyme)